MEKICPVQVMKVYSREEVLAPFFPNLGTSWRSVVDFVSRERTYIRTTNFNKMYTYVNVK